MLSKIFGENIPGLARTILFAAAGLVAAIISLYFFGKPSWIIFDLAQKISVKSEQNSVGLITLDQKSLDRLESEGVVFPLPRQIYGAVLEVAQYSQARAVVFDILFTEESSYGKGDDQLFVEFIEKSKVPVFFPAQSEKTTVKDPISLLKEQAAGLGAVNFSAEVDGVFRRAPDYIRDANSLKLTLPQSVFLKLKGDEVYTGGDLLVNYTEQAFPHIALYDILKIYRELQDQKSPSIDISELRNRIWVVGYTAPGLHDLKPMSLDHEAPGMMLQATGIANRFMEQRLGEVSLSVHIFLIFFLVLFSIFMMNQASDPFWASSWLLATLIIFPGLFVFVAWRFSFWANPIPLFSSILVAGGTQLIWNFHMLWKERLRFAKSLQNSMSHEMLKLIRSGDVQISRFGEEREVTVLFSDLEGFTTLSEKSSPAELVSILNAYLDEVVTLIMGNSGYIDKFIGDAVMVIWGAPIGQNNHAVLAFQTGLKFHEICEKFNIKMQEQNSNFKKLVTRVGLHTGKAIVGNIGAKQRHNYTAIGDCVNLASRLEGIGKNYHVELTLSEDVIRAANAFNYPGLLELDQIIVKGKSEPTRIYTMVDLKFKEAMTSYSLGLNLYYLGKWNEAQVNFKKARDIPASFVMNERCESAIKSGELTHWKNGAWLYDSK